MFDREAIFLPLSLRRFIFSRVGIRWPLLEPAVMSHVSLGVPIMSVCTCVCVSGLSERLWWGVVVGVLRQVESQSSSS